MVRTAVEAAPDEAFDLVDEAGEESFPASDPPAFTAVHSSGPVPKLDSLMARGDSPILAARLREDVGNLTGRRVVAMAMEERVLRAAREVESAFVRAGLVAARWPVQAKRTKDAVPEAIFAEIRGLERPREIVMVAARLEAESDERSAASGAAVLLALARSMGSLAFARTLRFAIFVGGDAASEHARAVAAREEELVASLIVDCVGLAIRPRRTAAIAAVANLSSRVLLDTLAAAFDGDARVPLRTIALPAFALRRSDALAFWRRHQRAVLVTDAGPFRLRRHAPTPLDYARMASVVPALERALERLAEIRGPRALRSPG